MQISELYKIFQKSTGICTDTRSIKNGELFFALKGPNFNANKLAKEAIKKGAFVAIIDDPIFDLGKDYILVDDALSTLQELANFHRNKFDIPIIGITGSNGKTTTKELIHAVLTSTYKVHATKGNLNNHIGVPLTLLSMSVDTEIAIIEMGANHIGEIAELCKIANPNFGLITNIGKAHLEGFGSFEGVARAKSELYLHLHTNKNTVFVNSADEHLSRMSSRIESIIKYPQEKDFYTCEYLGSSPFIKYNSNNKTINTQLIGKYNFYNVAAALCIGKYFKVNEDKANSAIAEYKATNNRSQIEKQGSNTIILDAYNANPSSMKAAIINFEEMNMSNKWIVLGDMFELGEQSKKEHQEIGTLLSECNFIQAIVVGKDMKEAHFIAPQSSIWFESKNEVNEWIKKNPVNNSTILVKGSRGMALESLKFN